MRRFVTLLFLAIALPVMAEGKQAAPTDLQRAITSQGAWLNTSRAPTPEDLQNRIVLLDFWTLGCINCMDIIPDLKALEQEFGGKLTVIGVHSAKFTNEKDLTNIENAVLRYGLSHPVAVDSDFAIWNAFHVQAWPTLVLLSPEGKIASVYAGEGHRAALESDIKALLTKYKGKLATAALSLGPVALNQADTPLRFPGKVAWGDIASGAVVPVFFVADSGHNRIVTLNPNGSITDTIGDGKEGLKDGSFTEAEFSKPQGIAFQDMEHIYVADLGNHALRVIDLHHKTVTTLAGTGKQGHILERDKEEDALKTALSSPWDVALWPDSNHLVIAMAGTHQLWSYGIEKHTVSLLAGNGQEALKDGQYPLHSLAQPSSLFAAGDTLYFTDAESSALRMIDKTGTITTLIGKGLFDFGYKEGGRSEARLQHPLGLTGDAEHLYIADTYNHSIRRYDIKDGTLHNYAGHGARGKADGTLAEASFNEPGGITMGMNKTLYVADTNNHALRAIDISAGKVTTLNTGPTHQP